MSYLFRRIFLPGLISTLGLFLVLGCNTNKNKVVELPNKADTAYINRLLDIGDSLYARKDGYQSFADAMAFYDSAARLAQPLDDVKLKGYIAFCKASVYNAWTKDPQRTVALFTEAATIFARDSTLIRRVFYCRYLIAHTYDNEKGKDSTRCVQQLYAIADSLQTIPRQVWATWHFIPDLAWVAANANNYTLAEQLLTRFTSRSTIKNDPNTNNYLDHYYLTRARIDVLHYRNAKSPYLDSLRFVYQRIKENIEKVYYGDNLAELYAATGNYKQAYLLHVDNEQLSNKISDAEGIGSLQNRLLQTQLESEKKDKAFITAQQENRSRLLWLLAIGLIIISLFSYRFFKGQVRYKHQSVMLKETNRQLDEKVKEVELLSKEMQHRIKNNLQMIQSLVYLQQHNTELDEVKANMQQMGLRIESIASLHQQLMHRTDEAIDLKAYITHMLDTVVGIIDHDKHVVTHFDIDPIRLLPKQSFPLGLILNEWITNSIKYAQIDHNTLSIYISVRKKNQKIIIDYRDSGQPTPQQSVKEGLGLRIIALLLAQLNGQLHQLPDHYFAYRLTIDDHGK